MLSSAQKMCIMPSGHSVEEAYGSFVPHYSKYIKVLESLLPLFTGIEMVQHKLTLTVEREIEYYKRRIREEEIENIITG